MTRRVSKPLAVLAAILALAACGKGPAEAALKAANQAFAAVKDEAMQFAPNDAKAVQGALAAAQVSFEKGDYKAAASAALEASGQVQSLASASAARKAELTTSWTELSAGLPKMMTAVKSRLDILSQSKSLPANLDKATLESAQAGLAAATQTWQEATQAAQAGRLVDAMANANAVKTRTVEIMGALGMPVPAAAR